MFDRYFKDLVEGSESVLHSHGSSSPDGVGWNRDDAEARYRVMLEMIRDYEKPVSLLDFGCGLSHFYDYIRAQGLHNLHYSGLDVSAGFLAASRNRFPDVQYFDIDVLAESPLELPMFDYVVMNGITHWRGARGQDEMFDYLTTLVSRLFTVTRVGLAFNVITKQVEWERDELFHVPIDPLLSFLSRNVSRHVVIRHDYGLFEYSVYLYRTPSNPDRSVGRLTLRSGVRGLADDEEAQ